MDVRFQVIRCITVCMSVTTAANTTACLAEATIADRTVKIVVTSTVKIVMISLVRKAET